MYMKSYLNKWGNSLGFRIPKHVVEELSLYANGPVDYRVEEGKLVIEPIPVPEYTLEELLSDEIDPEPEIDWGKPMGREGW